MLTTKQGPASLSSCALLLLFPAVTVGLLPAGRPCRNMGPRASDESLNKSSKTTPSRNRCQTNRLRQLAFSINTPPRRGTKPLRKVARRMQALQHKVLVNHWPERRKLGTKAWSGLRLLIGEPTEVTVNCPNVHLKSCSLLLARTIYASNQLRLPCRIINLLNSNDIDGGHKVESAACWHRVSAARPFSPYMRRRDLTCLTWEYK